MVFHLLDKDELQFPFHEPSLFQDLEEDLRLLADPEVIRSAYLKTIHALIEEYRAACASNLIDYSLFDTSMGLDRALVRYLTWRESLGLLDMNCDFLKPLLLFGLAAGILPVLIHRLTQRKAIPRKFSAVRSWFSLNASQPDPNV